MDLIIPNMKENTAPKVRFQSPFTTLIITFFDAVFFAASVGDTPSKPFPLKLS
jgi:hypothetical protein